MKRLFILYDSDCELCCRCRIWLARQPSYLPLAFVSLRDPEAETHFPGLRALHPDRELVVIADTGEVWQGEAAWVVCLWALREYREWALRFAHPALLPLARRLCEVVSANRMKISRWLKIYEGHEALRQKLNDFPTAPCGPPGYTGYCRTR